MNASTNRPVPLARSPAPVISMPDALSCLAIAALGIALYRRVAAFYWLSDDFFHFHLLASHPAASFLWDPRSGRDLPGRMFTPLLLLSMRADWRLFGLRPAAFHLHQLAAVAAAAVLLYGTLRLWIRIPAAIFGAVLFLLGAAIGPIASEVATRHYAEGLCLALLSTICFVRGARTGSRIPIAASVLLYLAAASAKEIFVPLPALLALLPDSRGRLRVLAGHAAALAVYPFWRTAMLGTLVGGYGLVLPARRLPAALAALPLRLANATFGPGGWAGWATLAVLAGLWTTAPPRGAREWMLVAVFLAAAVLPVLPVSLEIAPRYALVAWTGVVCAAAVSLDESERSRRGVAVALAAAALVLAFLAHRTAWDAASARFERQSVENRTFATQIGSGDVLVHPASYPAAMGELSWFRENVLRAGAGAEWFFDDLFLVRNPPAGSGKRYWEFDASSRKCRDVTRDMPARARLAAVLERAAAPLSARFEWGPGTLQWRLGPYETGEYAFALRDGADALPVPADGGYRLGRQRIVLRVKYEAPSGWTTYSPEIVLDPTRAIVSWDRRP